MATYLALGRITLSEVPCATAEDAHNSVQESICEETKSTPGG